MNAPGVHIADMTITNEYGPLENVATISRFLPGHPCSLEWFIEEQHPDISAEDFDTLWFTFIDEVNEALPPQVELVGERLYAPPGYVMDDETIREVVHLAAASVILDPDGVAAALDAITDLTEEDYQQWADEHEAYYTATLLSGTPDH